MKDKAIGYIRRLGNWLEDDPDRILTVGIMPLSIGLALQGNFILHHQNWDLPMIGLGLISVVLAHATFILYFRWWRDAKDIEDDGSIVSEVIFSYLVIPVILLMALRSALTGIYRRVESWL